MVILTAAPLFSSPNINVRPTHLSPQTAQRYLFRSRRWAEICAGRKGRRLVLIRARPSALCESDYRNRRLVEDAMLKIHQFDITAIPARNLLT